MRLTNAPPAPDVVETYDAFVSHATKDAPFLDSVADTLINRHRLNIWYDREELRVGDVLWDTIRKAIDHANYFVFVISPASIESWWCNRELEYARQLGKPLIPVEYQPIDEKQLASDATVNRWKNLAYLNWVSIRDILYIKLHEDMALDAPIAALVTRLQEDAEQKKVQAWLSRRAEDWDRNGRLPSLLLDAAEIRRARTWLKASPEHKQLLNATQNDYLNASIHQRRRIRRLQMMTYTGVLVLLAIIAATAVLINRLQTLEFRERVLAAMSQHTIGSNYYNQGDFQNARVAYAESLLRLNPGDAPWQQFTGPEYQALNINIWLWLNDSCLASAQLENYDEAKRDCLAVIEGSPDYAPTYIALAAIYRNLGEFKEAKQILDQLEARDVKVDPDLKAFFIGLRRGSIAYYEGDYDLALDILTGDAVSGYPLSPQLSAYALDLDYHIAVTYIGKDDTASACKWFGEYAQTMIRYPPLIRTIGDQRLYELANETMNELGCGLVQSSP